MKPHLPLTVAGLMLATALSGATPAAATTAGTTTGASRTSGQQHWITLLTGDQVLTDDKGKPIQFKPAPGREHIAVSTREDGAHLYAVPADVEPMITQGRLDRRLFDLALLSRPEYTKRQGLGVLVSAGSGLPAARSFSRIGVDAVTVTAGSAPDVWKSLATGRGAQTTIWLDAVRKAALDRSTAQIGAPQAWQAGFDGKGVKIAVLDTGVDNTHPDLTTQEIAEKNFTDSPDNQDRVGHGTHVASIAAGTGAKSGGEFKGVAPGARILDGKVLGDDGSGYESGILAGIEWAVEQQADVVNMSLGGDDGPLLDPMEILVNRLSQETGTLFVIASGNAGPNSVGSPGSADAALTVGAVDRDDRLASFSSTGPRNGDGAIKPDITAPGVGIGAAAAGRLGESMPSPAEGYISLNGTSMATPHVAGAAAILAQAHPDWRGDQIKAALMASAKPGAHNPFEQGAGRTDVAQAIKQTISSGSVSFGTALWPHHDDAPMTKNVVYRNEGDQPVTLTLKVDTAAPQGFFTLKDTTLAVPAHGTATTTLTADTKLGGDASGTFSAYINASGGGQSVVTPAAVTREPERYTITVKAIGRDGKPAANWGASLQGVTGDATGAYAGLGTGLESLRVAKGRYLLNGHQWIPADQPNPYYNWFNGTNIEIGADTTITLDARQAKPVDIGLPGKPAERHAYIRVGHKMPSMEYGFGLLGVPLSVLSTAHVGPEGKSGEMNELVIASYTGAGREEFHVVDQNTTLTKFWTGYRKQLKSKDLVTITASAGATAEGRTGYLHAQAEVGDSPLFGVAFGYALPHTRKLNLHSPNNTWSLRFEQDHGDVSEAYWNAENEQFKPGRTYRKTFNTGVFGPALTDERRVGLYRDGDILFGSLPFFADGQGRSGGSAVESGSTVLKVGGEVVDSTDRPLDLETFFSMPAAPGRYELTTTANRSGVAAISTSVTTTWGFDSATTPGVTQVPLSMVRFTPELGLDGTLPAHRFQRIPLTVQGKTRSLTAQVSYDKGATWQKALVFGDSLLVVNPARGGSVSLRATAVGRGGDSVTQTVINAYLTK
ncbi:S8 family serine peptidase [Lentzea californiensis]|uniref:S8 family serine peptidase n=1 Tax=Lentzea californiensis TaxID=438851 RepID=UPI0021655429|nr:S8 family serine peptidase [Lentzea californiensis]MCR3753595.1 Serine protease, subtilisin family [Lentzea californiensis]